MVMAVRKRGGAGKASRGQASMGGWMGRGSCQRRQPGDRLVMGPLAHRHIYARVGAKGRDIGKGPFGHWVGAEQ